jgi:uncharacterized protein YbaA (DUF1428 family)
MAKYVDGFVLPVPRDKVETYRQIAHHAGQVWREHGALEYVECVADDVDEGELTSFPRSVNLEDGETVVFAWITFESRAERDRINAEVMKDPRMAEQPAGAEAIDMKRMVYGGFDAVVEL